jgi:hypothetical protein
MIYLLYDTSPPIHIGGGILNDIDHFATIDTAKGKGYKAKQDD